MRHDTSTWVSEWVSHSDCRRWMCLCHGTHRHAWWHTCGWVPWHMHIHEWVSEWLRHVTYLSESLIHMCAMTHVCVCHDTATFMSDTDAFVPVTCCSCVWRVAFVRETCHFHRNVLSRTWVRHFLLSHMRCCMTCRVYSNDLQEHLIHMCDNRIHMCDMTHSCVIAWLPTHPHDSLSRPPPSLSCSLSLSLTHARTHTLSLPLFLSYTHTHVHKTNTYSLIRNYQWMDSWYELTHRVSRWVHVAQDKAHSIPVVDITFIERNPPPGGGFLFTMFPHQEPCVRDFTTKCDRRISSWNLLHTALDEGT